MVTNLGHVRFDDTLSTCRTQRRKSDVRVLGAEFSFSVFIFPACGMDENAD